MSGRPLARCPKCLARRYETEVTYDNEIKDFVCRDKAVCKKTYQKLPRKKRAALPEMRWEGIQQIKLS